MHTHLLTPMKFATDISGNPRYNALTGMIDFPFSRLLNKLQNIDRDDVELASEQKWRAKFRSIQYNLLQTENELGDKTFPPRMHVSTHYNPKKFTFTQSNPFSLDLIQAVKRQLAFARKITALYPYDPVPDVLLLDSQERYAKFMNLIRLNVVSAPVPAMDIDLFWHTHQLTSSNYLPWCTHHVGRPINHDDTTGEAELSNGLEDTITAWGENYFEDYLHPPPHDPTIQRPPAVIQQDPAPPPPTGPPPPGTFPGPTTADFNPPPGLTPAQLRLWRFDVACQAQHEQHALRLLNQQAALATAERQIAESNAQFAPLIATLKTERGSIRSLFRAVAAEAASGRNAAYNHGADPTEDRKRIIREMATTHTNNTTARKKWGRQRWPLLCAARGWGDARVTHGKFKRPPQGTTELPFPVFAATWYAVGALGYYDYFAGRGVEGGGMRIGGGMCGARFDGGNCTTDIVLNPQSSCTTGIPSGGC
jgi:Glycine-rich domain-containing protein-like